MEITKEQKQIIAKALGGTYGERDSIENAISGVLMPWALVVDALAALEAVRERLTTIDPRVLAWSVMSPLSGVDEKFSILWVPTLLTASNGHTFQEAACNSILTLAAEYPALVKADSADA